MNLTLTSDGPGSYVLTDDFGGEIMAGNDMRMLEAMARAMGHDVELDPDVMSEYHN